MLLSVRAERGFTGKMNSTAPKQLHGRWDQKRWSAVTLCRHSGPRVAPAQVARVRRMSCGDALLITESNHHIPGKFRRKQAMSDTHAASPKSQAARPHTWDDKPSIKETGPETLRGRSTFIPTDLRMRFRASGRSIFVLRAEDAMGVTPWSSPSDGAGRARRLARMILGNGPVTY